MASRSTRRRIKETEVSKLEECSNENDDVDNKGYEAGPRKSLRHSPGTSISPPHKTRRMMVSPSGVENKSPKSSPNTSMHNLQSSPDSISDILPEPEKITLRTSTRKSSRISSSSTNATPISQSGKRMSASPSPSKVTIPRRSARNKEIATDNSKTDDVLKDKLLELSNCQSPDQSKLTSLPSTSKVHKRNLSSSPDMLDTVITKEKSLHNAKKVKCELSVPISNIELINGKSSKTNLDKNVDGNITCNSQRPKNVSQSSTRAEILHSQETKPVIEKAHGDSNSSKHISKRLIPDSSPDSCSPSKKSRREASTNSLHSGSHSSDNISSENLIPVKGRRSPSSTECKMADSSNTQSMTNLRLLLVDELCLNQEQVDEMKSLIPHIDEDATYVVIIEALIENLLKSFSTTTMSSPRFNKFLRQLIMKYCSQDILIEKKHLICQGALDWSKERKSINLRHELELASMSLYYDTKFYRKAEEIATGLYKETKKLQDKEKTVKACLCLSKTYHAMGNISKARANITTAKTEALKIYTPPDLQAELDLQSGIMQVAEEKDMETAFSYFKEAASGSTIKALRSRALKYMLLTKLLINKPEEGEKAVKSQTHINDIDVGVEALLSINKAATLCSLAEFTVARTKYADELEDDLVVRGVLDELYAKMLEKNLLNIVRPYERMQIDVVAKKIGLVREEVERRLSQMILDGKITAQLDHRDNCLYLYDKETKDRTYEDSIDTVNQLDKTICLLSKKVKQLL